MVMTCDFENLQHNLESFQANVCSNGVQIQNQHFSVAQNVQMKQKMVWFRSEISKFENSRDEKIFKKKPRYTGVPRYTGAHYKGVLLYRIL